MQKNYGAVTYFHDKKRPETDGKTAVMKVFCFCCEVV